MSRSPVLVLAVLAGSLASLPAAAQTGPAPPQSPTSDAGGGPGVALIAAGQSLYIDPQYSTGVGPCRLIVNLTAKDQAFPIAVPTDWQDTREPIPPAANMYTLGETTQTICCRPQTITLCAGTAAATTYQLPYTSLGGQVTQSASCPAGQAGETYSDSQTWTCGSTTAPDPNNDDGLWGEGETDGCAAVPNATVGPAPACTVTCNQGYTWNGTACVADTGCLAGVASWGAGCSTTYGAMNNGDTDPIVNAAPGYTGSETLSCNAGVVTPSSQICNLSGCAAGSATWTGTGGTCAGSYGALNLNGSTPIANIVPGLTGSETAICVSDGTVSFSNPSCAVTGCPAGTLSWAGSGAGTGGNPTCSGPYAGMDVGGSTTDANTAAGVTGSASLGCLGPNDPVITASSCQAGCSPGSTTWLTNCGGNYGVIPAGGMTVVYNTLNAAYSGSELAGCSASGLVTFSNPTCAQIACPAGSTTWPSNCAGTYGLLPPGGSSPVNNTTAGYTGSETANCSAALGTTFTNPSCTANPCTGTAESWTAGDLTCTGTTGNASSGGASTATNTTANQTGSATYSCSLGAWSGPTASSCACASGYTDSAGTCVQDTYAWQTGACGGNVCPSLSGTRSVWCEDTTAGVTVANSNCTGTAPSTSCTVSTLCPVTGVCGAGLAGCQTPYGYANFLGCTGDVGNENCTATWNCLGGNGGSQSGQCTFNSPYQCGGNVPIGGCSTTP
jgi:hypothetical protein